MTTTEAFECLVMKLRRAEMRGHVVDLLFLGQNPKDEKEWVAQVLVNGSLEVWRSSWATQEATGWSAWTNWKRFQEVISAYKAKVGGPLAEGLEQFLEEWMAGHGLSVRGVTYDMQVLQLTRHLAMVEASTRIAATLDRPPPEPEEKQDAEAEAEPKEREGEARETGEVPGALEIQDLRAHTREVLRGFEARLAIMETRARDDRQAVEALRGEVAAVIGDLQALRGPVQPPAATAPEEPKLGELKIRRRRGPAP